MFWPMTTELGAQGGTIVLPWEGRPRSIAPIVPAWLHLLRGRRVEWAGSGERKTCDPWFFVRESARYLLFRAFDTTALLLGRLLSMQRAPTAVGGRSGDGPIVFVVAVLPDLSHTFIYREILAALRPQPAARVFCLARGHGAPVHPEAAALTEHTTTVPPHGVLRRYASILRWMLTAPRRTGRLFALYRRRSGGRTSDLLGKGPLREPRHPGRGFALADELAALRPRHIHVYGSTYAANVAMEAACLLDVPFSISSYVDFDFDYDFKMLREKFGLARFFRVCTRFCQGRMRDLLGLDDVARVPVILYGLELGAWPARTATPRRGALFSAARLVEKKGLHLVPPALALLAERGVEFSWRVAGDGPELPRLQAMVRELGLESRVEFLGPLGNDAVRTELERTELALLPCIVANDGERDGIPIFFTEAMALGVPVLSTPISGIPELVRDGDTGFLVEPGDVEKLAARLEAVLGNPELLRAVAARGRDEVTATHDVAHSAAELLSNIERTENP